MNNYTFVKNYKDNEHLRTSFCTLAMETFGIDFETWYQRGYWNENYIPFSFVFEGEIVSNVSVNLMTLELGGKIVPAIQIGTVMTDPKHRRKGLAHRLLQTVIENYDKDYDTYFLAADEDAVALYEKSGFQHFEEYSYVVDLSTYEKKNKAKSIQLSENEVLQKKKASIRLSNVVSAEGDEHVLMFYYLHGFKDMIHEVNGDILVIYEVEGEELNLYEVFSKEKVDLEWLLEEIANDGIERAVLHFTPDKEIKGLESKIDKTSNWMHRNLDGEKFPKRSRFPRISQT